MIEVPSAALLSDHFAREADFMSLGTNDLVQYSLAADRSSRELAYLASPFDPAVLRLVRMVADSAKRFGTPLSICGEMASDPLGSIVLLGLGLRDFSMEASAVPQIKESLGRVTIAEAMEVAHRVLEFDTADAVSAELSNQFGQRLADLIGNAG